MSTISAGTTSTTTLIHSGDTTGSLVLKTNDTGSGGTTAVTIDTSQNVGIGTSSPSSYGSPLSVYAATNPTFAVVSGNANAYLRLYSTSDNNMYLTNTGGSMTMNIANTERMRIDSSGNVGIGTSSPAVKLHVSGGTQRIQSTGSTSNAFLTLQNDVGTQAILGIISSGNSPANNFFIETNAGKTFQIDTNGNVGIGLTPSYRLSVLDSAAGARVVDIQNTASTGNPIMQYSTMTVTGTTSNYFFVGRANASDRVYIYGSGNIVNVNNSYGALSDVKLKENIIDATPKLADLMQVKVRNYNLIGETQKQIGVVAQELEQVFPSMVDETIDRDTEGNELETTTKSVKYSVFVPMLIKAIQEQQALIQQLQADVAALKGV